MPSLKILFEEASFPGIDTGLYLDHAQLVERLPISRHLSPDVMIQDGWSRVRLVAPAPFTSRAQQYEHGGHFQLLGINLDVQLPPEAITALIKQAEFPGVLDFRAAQMAELQRQWAERQGPFAGL